MIRGDTYWQQRERHFRDALAHQVNRNHPFTESCDGCKRGVDLLWVPEGAAVPAAPLAGEAEETGAGFTAGIETALSLVEKGTSVEPGPGAESGLRLLGKIAKGLRSVLAEHAEDAKAAAHTRTLYDTTKLENFIPVCSAATQTKPEPAPEPTLPLGHEFDAMRCAGLQTCDLGPDLCHEPTDDNESRCGRDRPSHKAPTAAKETR